MERETSLKNHFREKSLKKNFRSRAEIVDLNNRFFSTVSQLLPDETRKIYGETVQEYKKDDTGGFIRIEFNGKNDEDGIGYDEKTLQRINGIIKELLEEKFSLKDITILCRSNDDASEVAQHLMLNGIPVVSAESLLLSFSPEVGFIMDFFRLFNEPSDPIPKVSLVTFLYRTARIKVPAFHDCISWIREDKPTPDTFLRFLPSKRYSCCPYMTFARS
jgi:ATP-dependent exoDNAse (exonuclease V) beta subunit